MDGLLTFLIFAALVYFMMRAGCGAHMVHGRGAGGGHGARHPDADKHIDPVCGKRINRNTTVCSNSFLRSIGR
jgi:hypothetical protein